MCVAIAQEGLFLFDETGKGEFGVGEDGQATSVMGDIHLHPSE